MVSIKFQNSLDYDTGTLPKVHKHFYSVVFSKSAQMWRCSSFQSALLYISSQDNLASGKPHFTLANPKGNLTPYLPSTLEVSTGKCPFMLDCKMKMPNLYSQISTCKTLSQLFPEKCYTVSSRII